MYNNTVTKNIIMAKLHDTLELVSIEDRFVLIAKDKSGLQIDRRSGAISGK